jgi:cell wall-associated NlpC family hydrolase
MLSARRWIAAMLLVAGMTAIVPVGLTHATARPPASSVIGLHKGVFGPNVVALQNALNRVGVGVKYGVDGYFGSATRASVRAFQRFHGLPITGTVDAATARALGFASPNPARHAVPKAARRPAPKAARQRAARPAASMLGLRLGSRGPMVAQLQRAMIAMGWPPARGADGVFGASTQRTLMAIQRANGLIVTGATNIATARLLGLTRAATRPAAAPRTRPSGSRVTIKKTKAVPSRPARAVSPKARTAVTAALSQRGVPYKAYAMSPGIGFDCSGLTAWAWAQAGVVLPHQSGLQSAVLPHVATAQARPGDLLFYHSPVSHVTMYIGNHMQVQAARPNSVIHVGPVNWSHVVGVGRPR